MKKIVNFMREWDVSPFMTWTARFAIVGIIFIAFYSFIFIAMAGNIEIGSEKWLSMDSKTFGMFSIFLFSLFIEMSSNIKPKRHK